MNVFEYTCQKNPKQAIDVAQMFSNVPVKDGKTAYKVFVHVMQNANADTKERLLDQMREIHPDSDLYRDASGKGFWQISNENRAENFGIPTALAVNTPEFSNVMPQVSGDPQVVNMPKFVPTHNACGCGGCGSPKMYNATGGAVEQDLMQLKAEKSTRKVVFNVIIATILVVILYKLFVKK